MSWDIYGNPLRRGYCEVHPHVHEEYPCSVCMAERSIRNHQQQPSYEIEQLNYELDQQSDYIKELTQSNQNLSMALQKVSDYNLRLENERDALAAQVYRMSEFIRLSAKKWEGVPEVEPTFWNLLRVANEAPKQCLAEIETEAVLKFAGTVLVKYRYDITEWAKEYADKVRQGGE